MDAHDVEDEVVAGLSLGEVRRGLVDDLIQEKGCHVFLIIMNIAAAAATMTAAMKTSPSPTNTASMVVSFRYLEVAIRLRRFAR